MSALRFLGWSAVGVLLGEGDEPGGVRWTPLALDWAPGDIRNASYAAGPRWVGITAEDRTAGGQTLAVHDPARGTTEFRLRPEYVLHHDLDAGGLRACYTVPSETRGAADLWLHTRGAAAPERLAQAVAAQDAVPVWFPDGTRIAFHSPGGEVVVLDVASRGVKTMGTGRGPAVSPDGARLAWTDGAEVVLSAAVGGSVRRIRPLRRRRSFSGGLGWTEDGRRLSLGVVAGLTDKGTAFYLLDVETGGRERIRTGPLRGLRPLPRHP